MMLNLSPAPYIEFLNSIKIYDWIRLKIKKLRIGDPPVWKEVDEAVVK